MLYSLLSICIGNAYGISLCGFTWSDGSYGALLGFAYFRDERSLKLFFLLQCLDIRFEDAED